MTTATTPRTVLITGANSGLGFDSARQLAESGRWRVIVSARSRDKAQLAVQKLRDLTNLPPERFGAAVFDNHHPETIQAAVGLLAKTGETLDAVVLNAGGLPLPDDDGRPKNTSYGITELFSMNVAGHALLVDELVKAHVLKENATVMFAGSEVSRGIPSMRAKAAVLPEGLGDLDATLLAVAEGRHATDDYDGMHDYGLVKLIGTLWMRQLRDRHGLRALTVSPGFTAGTAGMKDLPAGQRFMFKYVALPIFRLMGNAHSLDKGAARYVQALEDESLLAGNFYASRGTKISGPLTEQVASQQPLLGNADLEAAVGRLIDAQVGRLRAGHGKARPVALAS